MRILTAGLVVELEPKGDLMKSRALPYLYEGDRKTDIKITVSQKFYEDRQKEYPNLTLDECEYLWSASYFYEQLALFGGVMLHSSCVAYDGKAYLFSADSGTGKSTHTHLWLKYLPGSYIVNDDKPAIRVIEGNVFAFGTPWSGKTDESVNEGVPVGGIAFLSRGANKITKVPQATVIKDFMNQTVRPNDKKLLIPMMEALDGILKNVSTYRLSCDMSEEAVTVSYNGMKNS